VKGPAKGRNLEQAGASGDGSTGGRIADTLEFPGGTSAVAATRWGRLCREGHERSHCIVMAWWREAVAGAWRRKTEEGSDVAEG
jgi:hypothetical protein